MLNKLAGLPILAFILLVAPLQAIAQTPQSSRRRPITIGTGRGA